MITCALAVSYSILLPPLWGVSISCITVVSYKQTGKVFPAPPLRGILPEISSTRVRLTHPSLQPRSFEKSSRLDFKVKSKTKATMFHSKHFPCHARFASSGANKNTSKTTTRLVFFDVSQSAALRHYFNLLGKVVMMDTVRLWKWVKMSPRN